jgi:hypothetical protein
LAAARTSDGPPISIFRGFHKRIQIDDNDVDEVQAMPLEGGQIVRTVTARENAAVHRRMKRLHAPIEHFGKSCEIRDIGDRQSGVREDACRSPG